jgi:hypothetical protein
MDENPLHPEALQVVIDLILRLQSELGENGEPDPVTGSVID